MPYNYTPATPAITAIITLLSLVPLLGACVPAEENVKVEIVNEEDTRLLYLAFEATEPTFATAIATIAQPPVFNRLNADGINPGESQQFELTCLFSTQYLNLRWEDNKRRFYRIATPCGREIRYNISQNL